MHVALLIFQENAFCTWDQPQCLRCVGVFLEIVTTGQAKRQVPDLMPCFVTVFWIWRYNWSHRIWGSRKSDHGWKWMSTISVLNVGIEKQQHHQKICVSVSNLPWVLFACNLHVNMLKVAAYTIYIVDHIALFLLVRISSWRCHLQFYTLCFKYLKKNNMYVIWHS